MESLPNSATSERNAKTSETNAASSAASITGAVESTAANAAAAAADADRAQSANPDNQLKKAMNLSDVADIPTARKNLRLGDSATLDVGTGAGTLAAGDDTRINGALQKSGGDMAGVIQWLTKITTPAANHGEAIIIGAAHGSNLSGSEVTNNLAKIFGPDGVAFSRWQHRFTTYNSTRIVVTDGSNATGTFEMAQTGNAIASGTWVNNSDERLKTNIQRIVDPLTIMRGIKGVTWDRLDNTAPGIGFIAQDVVKYFPKNVFETGDRELADGTVVTGVLSPDTSGVAAALHHEAILALMSKIDAQDAIIAELQKRMAAIDGLSE